MATQKGAQTASTPKPFCIGRAETAQDLEDVAELFLEYTQGLGIDLAYQSFDEELASLPGKYAPPRGALFTARATTEHGTAAAAAAGKPIGCVALRPLPRHNKVAAAASATTTTRCELKRLYVRPEARATGLGEALARRALAEAVALGYTEMVMDTLASMTPARRLYTKLGFSETTAYYETPIAETVFYRRCWGEGDTVGSS